MVVSLQGAGLRPITGPATSINNDNARSLYSGYQQVRYYIQYLGVQSNGLMLLYAVKLRDEAKISPILANIIVVVYVSNI